MRLHGMGCLDMDILWKPFPRYAGQDPTLAANYDWPVADECMANVYENERWPVGSAFVRFGHSRTIMAEHPKFGLTPDDPSVIAKVCAVLVHRYRIKKGYPVRNFSVWNEPSSPFENDHVSPFYRGTAAQYAELHIAVYTEIKSKPCGAAVRIGPALGLDAFSRRPDAAQGQGQHQRWAGH